MRLDELNALDPATAERELLRCCGSTRWARMMASARPFGTADEMLAAADRIWPALGPDDWLQAFRAHPRIGETSESGGSGGSGRSGGSDASGRSGDWSDQEQAGVRTARDAVRDRLAEGNRHYEARFGYIFIVCATGRSAEEMLAMLERRLTNHPDDELRIAAEEQRNITRLRIAKLVTP
jgi:OHCU decarboxylase